MSSHRHAYICNSGRSEIIMVYHHPLLLFRISNLLANQLSTVPIYLSFLSSCSARGYEKAWPPALIARPTRPTSRTDSLHWQITSTSLISVGEVSATTRFQTDRPCNIIMSYLAAAAVRAGSFGN